MSSQEDLVGSRYALGELLGEGAFAFTWLAYDVRLGREVALKILRQSFAHDASFSARFAREAVALAAVSHRNVVQVFDHGQYEGTFYIAMEYVAGRTLRQLRHDAGGRLRIDHAIDLTAQVLRGLQAVHRSGIYHRDIKPENVLVGHDGIARLADFGIATDPTGTSLTMTGTTLGTAAYMAPEQARGEPLTPAADLYAVGVVLFELLTGRLPFRADNAVSMMLAHQQLSPPSLRQAAPDAGIPARLEAIVLAALAKNPAARFPAAQAMERALLDRGESQQPVERTAPLRTVTIPRQPMTAPVAGRQAHRQTRSGRGWLLAVLLLLALAGSAAVAAWWTGATDDNDPSPTSTPRVLEVVPGDQSDPDEPEATGTEEDTEPTSTDEPQSTSTLVPIVPVETEIPTPLEVDTSTPEPRLTETKFVVPEPTSTDDLTSTPPPNGDSPPIEPIDQVLP